MDCAPFKTRSLRFEWETTIPIRPLIAKYAMNGAQLLPLSAILMTGLLGTPSSGSYAGKYLCWSYDAFGNRTAQSIQSSACSTGVTATARYNSDNQVTWTQVNAAGNVLNDGVNQYLYDANGRICAVASTPVAGITTMTGYLYGADGARVAKGSITAWSCDPVLNGFKTLNDYVLGLNGEQMTEMGVDTKAGSSSSTLAWQHSNVFAGGTLIATYDAAGLHFYLNDWNGSRRVQTDYEGVVEQTCTNLPYGDGESCSATPTEELYAGLERDSESGLDHAMFRQYASTFGRWTSPDPYGGSYNVYNPQSLNRYAYVGGSPLSGGDPSGLDPLSLVYNAPMSMPDLYDGWAEWLASTPIAQAIPVVGELYDIGDAFYDFGKSFGWWGGGSKFHGNATASQSRKSVPSAAAYAPLPDPDDERIRQLAVGINNEAGWIGTPQGVAGFYGASLVGAGAVVAAPAAAGAVSTAGQWAANTAGLLGPATGRVFWSGSALAASRFAGGMGGSILEDTPLGRIADIAQTYLPQTPTTGAVWSWLSEAYAGGAQGVATYFEGSGGYQGWNWLNRELPTLIQNGVPVIFH
jgi:RHS repeat-associated protein